MEYERRSAPTTGTGCGCLRAPAADKSRAADCGGRKRRGRAGDGANRENAVRGGGCCGAGVRFLGSGKGGGARGARVVAPRTTKQAAAIVAGCIGLEIQRRFDGAARIGEDTGRGHVDVGVAVIVGREGRKASWMPGSARPIVERGHPQVVDGRRIRAACHIVAARSDLVRACKRLEIRSLRVRAASPQILGGAGLGRHKLAAPVCCRRRVEIQGAWGSRTPERRARSFRRPRWRGARSCWPPTLCSRAR